MKSRQKKAGQCLYRLKNSCTWRHALAESNNRKRRYRRTYNAFDTIEGILEEDEEE